MTRLARHWSSRSPLSQHRCGHCLEKAHLSVVSSSHMCANTHKLLRSPDGISWSLGPCWAWRDFLPSLRPIHVPEGHGKKSCSVALETRCCPRWLRGHVDGQGGFSVSPPTSGVSSVTGQIVGREPLAAQAWSADPWSPTLSLGPLCWVSGAPLVYCHQRVGDEGHGKCIHSLPLVQRWNHIAFCFCLSFIPGSCLLMVSL